MNIEIANRLVNLRKNNSLSQEALAEKLGISRQAVSKWERAEASPDTDNLIMLARLYGVSLDELLKTEDDIPQAAVIAQDAAVSGEMSAAEEVSAAGGSGEMSAIGESGEMGSAGESGEVSAAGKSGSAGEALESAYTGEVVEEGQENSEYVHAGTDGVHIKDKDGSEVHIGWDGIHVDNNGAGEESVHIDKRGVYVNGKKYDKNWIYRGSHFPFAIFITVLYIILGVFFFAWHPAWMLFLLIPIWHSFVGVVNHRNANMFAYPVLATLLFLAGGFFWGTWHPGWVIFITIPLYYALVSYIQNLRKEEE